MVKKGVADLRCWDGLADIALGGDWQLEYQSRDRKVQYQGLAPVPKYWRDFSRPLPYFGRGVYTIELLLPRPMDHLGLWLTLSSKSRKVFVVDAQGRQTLLYDSTNTDINQRSLAKMQLAPISLPALGTSSQLVMVVNNSEILSGGVSDAIIIGPIAKMWPPIQKLKNTALVVSTLLLVFALINLSFWLSQRRDWPLLLMTILALALSLRSLALSGLLYDYFPSLNSRHDALLGWGTYMVGTISGSWYYRYSYPLLIPRAIPLLVTLLTTTAWLLLSFLPIHWLQLFDYYFYRPVTIALSVLVIVMLTRGLKSSDSELKIILFSSMVLIVGVVAEEAYVYVFATIPPVSFSSLSVVFFVGVLTALMSRRYSRSLIQGATLSAQLQILNAQLEQKVDDRTAELAIKNQQLENISRTDSLTNIANRRAFDEKTAAEAARSKRSGLSMVIAIIDLDYFKRVNDEFGHNAGDEILTATASILANGARSGDFVARWGGEEFAMVLPETDLAAAQRVAERLRRNIADQQFDFDGRAHAITASFGLAVCEPNQGVNEAIKQADFALYRAKESGRDCVLAFKM